MIRVFSVAVNVWGDGILEASKKAANVCGINRACTCGCQERTDRSNVVSPPLLLPIPSFYKKSCGTGSHVEQEQINQNLS